MKKILLSSIFAALSTSIFAADIAGKPYIALDLGKAKYSNVEISSGIKFEDPGAFKFAAGYQFTNNIAAEIGYTVFGDSTLEVYSGYSSYSATVALRSTHISLIADLPVSDKFSLTGKVGYSKNKAEITDSLSNTFKDDASSAIFGIGAQYHFTPKFTLRAQYENYGKFSSDDEPVKASVISLGTVFRF